MPDYECFPLWETLSDGSRNLSPDELPISAELKQRLRAWAQRYDETLRRDDPASSGFASEEQEHDFESEGLRLWSALRAELGALATVAYFSQKLRRAIAP